jgi:hypothetical protein
VSRDSAATPATRPLLTNIAIDVFKILEGTPAWQEFLKSQLGKPFPF